MKWDWKDKELENDLVRKLNRFQLPIITPVLFAIAAFLYMIHGAYREEK